MIDPDETASEGLCHFVTYLVVVLLLFYNTAVGENCRKILGLVCHSEPAETLKYYAFHPYGKKKRKISFHFNEPQRRADSLMYIFVTS